MREKSSNISILGDDAEALQDEESVSLSQILHVFWLHRWVFFLSSSFIIILATIALLQVTPRFTAESKLLIGIAQAKVVDIEAVLGGDMTSPQAVKDEIEVLTSRELAKKVIEKLNLLDLVPPAQQSSSLALSEWLPDDVKEMLALASEQGKLSGQDAENALLARAVDSYLAKLKVSSVRGSRVIKIAFESTDPKLAAEIANTHADTYIIGQLEAKFEATQKATSWLNEQLSKLRTKVADSEKAVEAYRSEHNLTRGTGDVGLLKEQLSELNSQLIVAKAKRAEAAARLAQVKRLLKSGSGAETAAEVLSSSFIQSLNEQEAMLTRKISEMSIEYGEKHPKMIRVKAEKKEIERKIKVEIKKIAAKLENELVVANSRQQSLQSSLNQISRKSSVSDEKEVTLRALEREAAANKLLFENFLNRFKETSSTQGMEEPDARIISMAEIPRFASYPKKRLMFGIIVVGAFLAASAVVFMLETLNPGLRTPEEVEKFLGMPTLGLIPAITDKKLDPVGYPLERPHSQLAESLNSLRVSLSLSDIDNPVRTVMVTSSLQGEGKSTLALALGRNAANSGQRVIIIDSDLRHPSLEKKLGLKDKKHKGLIDLLMSKETQLSEFIFKDEKSDLIVMPKGQANFISSTDVLASERMKSLINVIEKEFDLIVFDSPPVMAVADARALAPLMDKTIFVVHWDKTPKKVIKAGLQQMVTAQPNVAGIVLQQVNLKRYGSHGYGDSGYYYYHGKYGQYYSN